MELQRTERNMTSHIQTPKFVLKNFEDNRGTLYQLDAGSMEIKLGHAKSINTKKGYFANRMEDWMQKNFKNHIPCRD